MKRLTMMSAAVAAILAVGAVNAQPDLRVVEVKLNKLKYAPREVGTVTVIYENRGTTISNDGSETAVVPFMDIFRHAIHRVECGSVPKGQDGATYPRLYKRVVLPVPDPGCAITIAVPFVNYAAEGVYCFRVFVDSTCVAHEPKENNNQRIMMYMVRQKPSPK